MTGRGRGTKRKYLELKDDTSNATIDKNGKGRAVRRKFLERLDDTSNATIDKNERKRFRKVRPAHYTFEIESFSSLLETKVEKYETKDFEIGGYKWRMILYPNGRKKEDGNDHISLFLAMTESDDVSLGWEVNVIANFFVFDRIRDRYLVVQDADRVDWRFHNMKMEWGYLEFLSHDTLHDPANGLLVDDCCTFGVEVFVIKKPGEGECLSFVKEPANGLQTFEIYNFSTDKSTRYSEVFTVEGRKWKLQLYPEGDSNASGTHLSLYLSLDDSETLQTGRKLYVKCSHTIKNNNGKHYKKEDSHEYWFDAPGKGRGVPDFIPLDTLKEESNGYLVNDYLEIETKFILVSVVKDFSPKKKDLHRQKSFCICFKNT